MTRGFSGTITALVTAFDREGRIDEEGIHRHVRRQVEAGVDAVIACGSTGESVALSSQEILRVTEVTVEAAAGDTRVLAGAAGNPTSAVAALARDLGTLGVDGLLATVPAYNKPSQEGMRRHFLEVADASAVPVMLYNVPGRTGSNLLPDTVVDLAAHERIVSLKEASGSLVQMSDVIRSVPRGFTVLSGDDELTLPGIALGAAGVVSVVSNQAPAEMCDLVRAARSGDAVRARAIHYRLLELMRLNFRDPNPVPAKTSLAWMGVMESSVRLPLTPLRTDLEAPLRSALERLELLEGA